MSPSSHFRFDCYKSEGPRVQGFYCSLQMDFYSTLVLREIPRKIVLSVLEAAAALGADDSRPPL